MPKSAARWTPKGLPSPLPNDPINPEGDVP